MWGFCGEPGHSLRRKWFPNELEWVPSLSILTNIISDWANTVISPTARMIFLFFCKLLSVLLTNKGNANCCYWRINKRASGNWKVLYVRVYYCWRKAQPPTLEQNCLTCWLLILILEFVIPAQDLPYPPVFLWPPIYNTSLHPSHSLLWLLVFTQ